MNISQYFALSRAIILFAKLNSVLLLGKIVLILGTLSRGVTSRKFWDAGGGGETLTGLKKSPTEAIGGKELPPVALSRVKIRSLR